MKYSIKFIGVLLLIFIHSEIFSQKKLGYDTEFGGYFSTNSKLPFWLQNNKFGAAPQNPSTAFIRQRFYSKTDSLSKSNKINYGLDAIVFNGKETNIRLIEAFLEPTLGPFHLLIGRKKQLHGIGDSTLSSGSMTWSGNALPIPEIQIGIRNFYPLGVKWFAIKGHLSHGWFGNQTYVKGYYLHQKSLYFRLGNPSKKLNLYTGVLHNAQWGGTPKFNIDPNDGRLTNGKFPSDWFTFKQVFFPKAALVDTTLGYGAFEVENRFGAHLGQVDFAAKFSTTNFSLLAYKQIPIETGRTIGSLSNLDDGVYGVSISNKNEKQFFKKLVLEYLYTMNQHSYQGLIARLLKIPPKDYMNDAFLFNHMQYIDGWTYNTRTIGSPFLIPQRELRTERKINDDYVFINNNRIKALYLGFNGQINDVQLTVKTSFSNNFGAISRPISPVKQNSYLFILSIPLKTIGGNFKTSIALDQGDLIYDNYGIAFSFCKSW